MVYLETFVLQNVAGTYKYIIILLITISYLVWKLMWLQHTFMHREKKIMKYKESVFINMPPKC